MGDARHGHDEIPDYSDARRALLIAKRPGEGVAGAIAAAGLRLTATLGFDQIIAPDCWRPPADVMLFEASGADADALPLLLEAAIEAAADDGIALVAVIEPAQIDLAAAHLFTPSLQLLCAPSMTERTTALAIAASHTQLRLHDIGRDAEHARLQRLHEEVARIADTLARLTRGEDVPDYVLREPGSDYRGPDEDGAGKAHPDVKPGEVRAAIRSRRLRGQFFTAALFADPAWDMLLDLFAAYLERRRVSVSSLCIAAAVPPTTALRWITTMHEHGLFERHADPADRRRAYIALSQKALEGMRAYLSAVKRAGLPIA